MRYFYDKTQSEIAKRLGVSQVQVSRLENKILENLKKAGLDLGKLGEFYDKYKDVETVPYFDREYLPSGMWETLCSTGTGILTNQLTVEKAVQQAKANYERLK